MADIAVREFASADITGMCLVLNEIIEIGGTTALQGKFSTRQFAERYLEGGDLHCCFVAVDDADGVLGFQMLHAHTELPADWGDIATFARLSGKVRGVGRALFARTQQYALESGLLSINATIRADNDGGLAYYDKMGFVTYSIAEGKPLADGALVDRISKKFDCV